MLHFHVKTSPSALPPELLGRIFEEYIQLCREAWGQRKVEGRACPPSCASRIGPYTWIYVTHVCRYWRDVALCNPLLWSDIVLTCQSECIETMITRSRQVPLTVQTYTSCCSTDRPVPLRSLRLVLKNMYRIRTLELYVKWWVFLDDVGAPLRDNAALLRSLTLSTPSGLYDTAPVQPCVNLACTSPLEHLTLCSYGFPWFHASAFTSLKSLHIKRGVPLKPSVDEVVRGLQAMPSLESLTLDDVFCPSSPGLQSLPIVSETATLASLQSLVLTGDCIANSTLLSSLELPQGVRITLDYHHTKSPYYLAMSLRPAKAKLSHRSKALQKETFKACLRQEEFPVSMACYIWSSSHHPAHFDSGVEALDTADLIVKVPLCPPHQDAVWKELMLHTNPVARVNAG
jgi:hypothetical protein